jgi:hypothetical protein
VVRSPPKTLYLIHLIKSNTDALNENSKWQLPINRLCAFHLGFESPNIKPVMACI